MDAIGPKELVWTGPLSEHAQGAGGCGTLALISSTVYLLPRRISCSRTPHAPAPAPCVFLISFLGSCVEAGQAGCKLTTRFLSPLSSLSISSFNLLTAYYNTCSYVALLSLKHWLAGPGLLAAIGGILLV